MNLDNACDLYKEMIENPQLYPKHRWLKVAESDYEHSLSEPRETVTKEINNFNEMQKILKESNL